MSESLTDLVHQAEVQERMELSKLQLSYDMLRDVVAVLREVCQYIGILCDAPTASNFPDELRRAAMVPTDQVAAVEDVRIGCPRHVDPKPVPVRSSGPDPDATTVLPMLVSVAYDAHRLRHEVLQLRIEGCESLLSQVAASVDALVRADDYTVHAAGALIHIVHELITQHGCRLLQAAHLRPVWRRLLIAILDVLDENGEAMDRVAAGAKAKQIVLELHQTARVGW